MAQRLTIGLDLDNTIARYDSLLQTIAHEKGWLNKPVYSKKLIRESVRKLINGEEKWQQLQAKIYGPQMNQAELFSGVKNFLSQGVAHQADVFIISHKTQYATLDNDHCDLRLAALNWMNMNDLLRPDQTGLTVERVFFESTREEKINRIRKLKCSHYIDDLEEVLLEESFPKETEKLHFTPDRPMTYEAGLKSFSSWDEITDDIFLIHD